jgi:hypothetical protein
MTWWIVEVLKESYQNIWQNNFNPLLQYIMKAATIIEKKLQELNMQQ